MTEQNNDIQYTTAELNEFLTIWQTTIEEENDAFNNNTCANCLHIRTDWYDNLYYCSLECKNNKQIITIHQYQLLITHGFIQGNIINNDEDNIIKLDG